MPTELEELVEFLHHPNPQIRQIAAENLVGYSTAQPTLFKRNTLEPISDLKRLLKDPPATAKDSLTILINISTDVIILNNLVSDDEYLINLIEGASIPSNSKANLICMLLANLAKSEKITKLLNLKVKPVTGLSTSDLAIDQLLDLFVKGADGTYNKTADYDYLSYLFADLARYEPGRHYLLTPSKDGLVPITKIMVFTEHASAIRRRGVANTIKNVSFNLPAHYNLLASEEDEPAAIGLLPYLLLPLMGPESYPEEDEEGMLDECQMLPPDKKREIEDDILSTHLETLLLLTTQRSGRDRLREVKVYPIVRELHLAVEVETVRESCDRLVQVLMRGEEGEENTVPKVQEIEAEDEDEAIIEVL